jgi:RNA-directed DNA polymerase
MPTSQVKPFDIPKQMVWEAYRRVAANKGAPGVDEQTLDEFEADLKNNLLQDLESDELGSYFPPPVKGVEIPKPHGGGVRLLGVPTVADRVAQTVVAMHLERGWNLGSTPTPMATGRRRRPMDAVGGMPAAVLEVRLGHRSRCREVLRFGAVGPHRQGGGGGHRHALGAALCEAVAGCTAAAPRRHLVERDKGTPQGSAVSPILANLFMHFAFDTGWSGTIRTARSSATPTMLSCTARARSRPSRCSPRSPRGWKRWAYGSTRTRRGSSIARTGSAGGDHEHTSFTFLGFTFRAREAQGKTGAYFTFLPAMSTEALKAKSTELRAMRIHRRTTLTLDDLARWLNPIVAGWMNYYGRFYRSAMAPLLRRVNTYLRRWAGKKYRRLRTYKRFKRWWTGLIERQPGLFAQWKWVRAF